MQHLPVMSLLQHVQKFRIGPNRVSSFLFPIFFETCLLPVRFSGSSGSKTAVFICKGQNPLYFFPELIDRAHQCVTATDRGYRLSQVSSRVRRKYQPDRHSVSLLIVQKITFFQFEPFPCSFAWRGALNHFLLHC